MLEQEVYIGSCKVIVGYKYRVSNCTTPPFYDVYISYVTLPPESYFSCLSVLQSMNFKSLVDDAARQLLIANPMGFPPYQEGECITTWRVGKKSCWKSAGYPWPKDHIFEQWWWYGCKVSEGCCVDTYKVCKRFGQLFVEHLQSVEIGQHNCDSLPNDPLLQNNGNCYFLCD